MSNHFDLVIYGGTAAAVTAAIQADRMGLLTALVSPDKHLGGMVSGGLGWVDSKDGRAVGGLAREFHHRVWKHYRQPEAWTRVEREAYQDRVKAQPGTTVNDKQEVMWTFEPHVAEKVLDEWLAETKVQVFRDEWLDRNPLGVKKEGTRITGFHTRSGRLYSAAMFIDATYEGDLMAAAGVTYRVGRDAAVEFNEPLNGLYFKKPGMMYADAAFKAYGDIDPYKTPGDPASGFIKGIEGELRPDERLGDPDSRLQAFNLRLCLTNDPANRLPVEKPAGYNEANYELLLRIYEGGNVCGFSTQEMPNAKTDSNNSGVFSLDYIGGNYSIAEGWNYSDASYEKRAEILADHLHYTQGLLWTIMNHPRVPEQHRQEWLKWGPCKDEFTDNGGWPHQVYVREARRMWGTFVMTQHHVQVAEGHPVPDSVGLGSYSLDSHNIRRVVIEGRIRPEGGFYLFSTQVYPISYGAIIPKKEEVTNLLVPVTLSATHAAFGSIRMEPTYMILGQSAATAAALALQAQTPVQDLPYATLAARLKADGQVLEGWPAEKKG
jgi:hypothetical protein